MITDIRKSINAILYERVTSPLYGAFIVTWIAWNWKIVYLTFFVSESEITGTKIDFILNNYLDISHAVTYPIISTVLAIIILPLFTNGAFWLNLKYRQWRINAKNSIEKKQLLTLEQSLEIKKQAREMEREFVDILQNRNDQIETFKKIELEYHDLQIKYDQAQQEISDQANKIMANNKLYEALKKELATRIKELTSVRKDLATKEKELTGVRKDLVTKEKELTGVRKDLVTKEKELTGVRKDLVTKEKELTGVRKDLVTKEKELTGVRKDLSTKEEKFDITAAKKDYSKFKKDPAFKSFPQVVDSIMRTGGMPFLEYNISAFYIKNKLVVGSPSGYEMTEKGMFFYRLYLTEKKFKQL